MSIHPLGTIPGVNLPHKVKRYRFPDRGLRLGPLGTECAVCGQIWQGTPNRIRTACPGVLVYYDWESAQAAGLRTATQWRKEHRKVTPDAVRSAAMDRGPTHYGDWYDLYSIDQTTPMKERKPREPQ